MAKKTTTKKTAKKAVKKATKKAAKTTTKKKAVKEKRSTVKTKTAPKKQAVPKKKSSTMSSRDRIIQQIKQDLINQKESLLRGAEDTLNALPTDLNFPDMGDQATAETDRNFMLRLRDRERMLLKKIDETIERIDKSEYGICEDCGAEIGIKRLQARPVTTSCIECKTLQEEEERIAEGS